MENNNILSKYQTWFRKRYSSETAMNYVINRWKNIRRNKKVMIFEKPLKRLIEAF